MGALVSKEWWLRDLEPILRTVPTWPESENPYAKIGVDRAWVVCVCRQGHELRVGFHRCKCSRTFVFTGRTVRVIPRDA